jgi:hypothetical protein
MKFLLLLVLLLNIADAIFTSLVVGNATAVEANPLMGALLEYGIAPFVIVKLLITLLSLGVLWKYRKKRIARIGAAICVFIYIILMCYVICASIF